MITLTRQRRNGIKYDYIIYEPGDILPAGVRVVEYRNRRSAMRGEYVTDINGRMVPLLRRVHIKAQGRDMFIFPGYCWQPWKNDMFSYPLEKAQAPDAPKTLTGKHMAMAAMINDGVEIEAAVRKLWPRSGKRQVMVMIRRAFANSEFVHYLLVELGYMNKLKAALESKGMTIDTIADEIHELATSKKANPTLKKWALETALGALDSKEQGKPLPELQSAPTMTIEAIMATRLQRLPQATAEMGALEGDVDAVRLLNDITEAGNIEIQGVDGSLHEGD